MLWALGQSGQSPFCGRVVGRSGDRGLSKKGTDRSVRWGGFGGVEMSWALGQSGQSPFADSSKRISLVGVKPKCS